MDHAAETPGAPAPTTISRRNVLKGISAGASLVTLTGWTATERTATQEHPRLWLTASDLPRLRGWATAENPIWQDGILPLAEEITADMDAGTVPGEDGGTYAWEEYPIENYSELFAFLSLVHPDETARANYADRARTLLMHAINQAAQGPAEGQPFRDPAFATADRSRWWGEGFALTVDWIYPILTDDDKATIREVFLRWVDENTNASTTSFNHPEPIGAVNDPVLLSDPIAVRWAGNNYFTAHMRNIGLMALCFDEADDPDGALTGNLAQATGAWLYMVDALLRGDSLGGLPAEGFEYSPQALAYVVQFLLALHTAGQADPEVWGPQVVLTDNPFWNEWIPAYLHSLSPVPVLTPDYEYLGPVYQPAWYGDGQTYWAPDCIALTGALGWYADLTGDARRLDSLRWIQSHLAPGGPDAPLPERVADAEDHHDAILNFLLFDPKGGEPTDPRPSLPLIHFSGGLGRLLVRTSWDEDATWFTWALGWNTVDHQHADGNQFEFYRQGEWLTKERTGYGFNIGSSDYHNTLALENDPPEHNEPDDYRSILYQRGSQWLASPSGDPAIVALSAGDGFVHAWGDATNLYNSEYEGSVDIVHASRSILWLQPDHIVVYDRATSTTAGRFKRFWLNLPAEARLDGPVATMTTASGQQLVVTTLLPTDAEIHSEPAEPLEEDAEPAQGDPISFRLRVEAPGGPTDVRFLHVLQGADAGVTADTVALVESSDGAAFSGAVFASTVVLFPIDTGSEVAELTYTVPTRVSRHLVTGLQPNGGYDVAVQDASGELAITIRPGTAEQADEGGLLMLDTTSRTG